MAENKKYHFRQILSTLLKEETNFSSAKQSSKLNSRRGIAKKPKNGLILSLTVYTSLLTIHIAINIALYIHKK